MKFNSSLCIASLILKEKLKIKGNIARQLCGHHLGRLHGSVAQSDRALVRHIKGRGFDPRQNRQSQVCKYRHDFQNSKLTSAVMVLRYILPSKEKLKLYRGTWFSAKSFARIALLCLKKSSILFATSRLYTASSQQYIALVSHKIGTPKALVREKK